MAREFIQSIPEIIHLVMSPEQFKGVPLDPDTIKEKGQQIKLVDANGKEQVVLREKCYLYLHILEGSISFRDHPQIKDLVMEAAAAFIAGDEMLIERVEYPRFMQVSDDVEKNQLRYLHEKASAFATINTHTGQLTISTLRQSQFDMVNNCLVNPETWPEIETWGRLPRHDRSNPQRIRTELSDMIAKAKKATANKKK